MGTLDSKRWCCFGRGMTGYDIFVYNILCFDFETLWIVVSPSIPKCSEHVANQIIRS